MFALCRAAARILTARAPPANQADDGKGGRDENNDNVVERFRWMGFMAKKRTVFNALFVVCAFVCLNVWKGVVNDAQVLILSRYTGNESHHMHVNVLGLLEKEWGGSVIKTCFKVVRYVLLTHELLFNEESTGRIWWRESFSIATKSLV